MYAPKVVGGVKTDKKQKVKNNGKDINAKIYREM